MQISISNMSPEVDHTILFCFSSQVEYIWILLLLHDDIEHGKVQGTNWGMGKLPCSQCQQMPTLGPG